MDSLRKEGKTKYIGLSECSAETLREANSSKWENTASGFGEVFLILDLVANIDVVQAEYSPFETLHETDGLIDTAKELNIAYVAYSPLGHGWLVDDFPYKSPEEFADDDIRKSCSYCLQSFSMNTANKCLAPKFQGENFYKNRAIVEEIKGLAKKKGCSLTQLALAFVMSQGMIPIPGTTKPKRLEENFASREISLSEEELKGMRAIIDRNKPVGNRYSAAQQEKVGH
jgi:aryl-alcohol dehydrogenase-like predicted oxidoreductase